MGLKAGEHLNFISPRHATINIMLIMKTFQECVKLSAVAVINQFTAEISNHLLENKKKISNYWMMLLTRDFMMENLSNEVLWSIMYVINIHTKLVQN